MYAPFGGTDAQRLTVRVEFKLNNYRLVGLQPDFSIVGLKPDLRRPEQAASVKVST
jgi:hypothetical protein